jgi:transposase
MTTVSVQVELEVPDGVTIRGYERHEGAHVFEVDFAIPPRYTCFKCGREAATNLRAKNDVLAIRDLDLQGQPTFWVYQPPLHQCPHCRQRTQITLPFKRERVTYTYRFEQYALQSLIGSSVEDVARRLCVSAEMVEGILEHQLEPDREIPATDQITSLGFDELSLKKRHKLYVTVMSDLTDPKHPRILAVVKGRDRAATEACLSKLAPRQRAEVRSHRTDMSAVYPQVCGQWLPNSSLVLDRFHVSKKLGELVDRWRKKPANSS